MPAPDIAALRFDPVAHRYSLAGRRLPSITEVLSAQKILDFSAVPPDRLEAARERGSRVHLAIKYVHEGTLDPASVGPGLDPYLFAFDRFCLETGCAPVLFEEPLAHATLGFAGTPDLAGPVYGEPSVIEVKVVASLTSAYGVQTAAQKLLLAANAYPVTRRYAVNLRDDGSYQLEPHKDPMDEHEFRSALFTYLRRLARNGGSPHGVHDADRYL